MYAMTGGLHKSSLVSAPSYGFSKYSDRVMKDERNRPLRASVHDSGFSGHPCPEISDTLQNIKKISYSCARQLREHFVQSVKENLLSHLLIL